MTNPLTPDSQSTPDSESGDAQAARYHVISDSPGIDNAEQWSESFEGKEYEVGISTIHLSTTKVDVGPPLHTHPYPEVVKIRRGRSTFTIGTKQLSATAGQTVFVPAGTPHTFPRLLRSVMKASLSTSARPSSQHFSRPATTSARHEQTVAELDPSSGVTYPRTPRHQRLPTRPHRPTAGWGISVITPGECS